MDRVKRRLAERMTPEGQAVGFCGLAQEKKPPEPYFALEGDEEKLPEEFQDLPPRRGGGAAEEEQGGTWQDQAGAAGNNEAAALEGKESGGEGSRRLSEPVSTGLSGMSVSGTPLEWQHPAAKKGIEGGAGAEPSAWRHDTGAHEVVSPGAEAAPPSHKGEGKLSGVGWSSGRRKHGRRQRRRPRSNG